MMTNLYARACLLTFAAPTAALLPIVLPPRGQELAPADVAALHACFDPSLSSLRAGNVDMPAPLGGQERAELAAAQHQDPSLAAMRAGFSPSNHEWTWLAIGAGIVLLIILI